MLTSGFEKIWSWIEKVLTGQDGANRNLASQMGQEWLPDLEKDKEPGEVVNSAFQSNSQDLTNINFEDAIKNYFTGNIDYQRQFELQQVAQDFNALEAQKARDYNLMMSNTAYQRQVEDLQNAGLNPLVALGGSGATSGYSTSASSGIPSANKPGANYSGMMASVLGLLSSSLNSAIQTNNLDKKLDLMKEDLKNKRDNTRLKASELSWKKSQYSRISSTPQTDEAVKIFNRLFS